jgi:hypothetical protein
MNKPQLQGLFWAIEDCKKEWEAHTQPRVGAFGNVTFRNITDLDELARVVAIQELERKYRRALRREVGIFRHIWYLFAPLSFYKSLE